MSTAAITSALQRVAQNNGIKLSQKVALELNKEYRETIKAELASKGTFRMEGLGTFSVVKRGERSAPASPGSPERVVIPERNALTFKVSSTLKPTLSEFAVKAKRGEE
eukprot:TRINITY_DN1430_c0_g1_i2.p1 TRINITY_DN1430_c0_g1~~TRINITY_DN1430_c0_g1_i2.p1  ORF type:complete len:125 (+),score=34.85 TRINITY_DN1430_c0_g1_i2:54-377(+)